MLASYMDIGYHYCHAVATKGVPQEICEGGLSVGDVFFVLLT